MRHSRFFLLTALLLVPLAASHAADNAERVLVGVNYFAGWWEPLPNKWHDPIDGSDWRKQYPGRVPLLGEFNTQATMDREIEAAAEHGIAFFSILWYPIPSGAEYEQNVRNVNAGLEHFLASPQAGRIKFMVELCNHPPFVIKSSDDWTSCIRTLLPAFKHPSYLRVGGKLVFKIHRRTISPWITGTIRRREKEQLDRLRRAVQEAGLGEILIGGGVMGGSAIGRDWPAARLFDFTNTYMDIPKLELKPADYPYDQLAKAIRQWNAQTSALRAAVRALRRGGLQCAAVEGQAASLRVPDARGVRRRASPDRRGLRRAAQLRSALAGRRAAEDAHHLCLERVRRRRHRGATRGENYSKLEAIRDLFPNKHETNKTTQP